jgi:hypothetical protein
MYHFYGGGSEKCGSGGHPRGIVAVRTRVMQSTMVYWLMLSSDESLVQQRQQFIDEFKSPER